MKDIIISVDSTSHKVNFPDEFLGIGYENLQGNLIFQFDNNFIGGQARLDISIDCESGMIPNLTPYENGYILPIKSSLLTGSNVLMQLVIDETSLTQYSLTTDTEINPNKTYYEKVGNDYIVVENPVVGDISQYYEANTPVFKTDIFQLKVKDSINAQETIPEQYPTWINTLNTLIGTINQKLGLVDIALTEMNNLNINVSDKVDGKVTITFTDKQGNQKEVKINDGRGIISIEKTSTSGNIDTYTITYTDDTTSTFEVINGIDGTDGRGIVSIEKTGTTGLVDTYTITYTDNTTSTFNVANGKGITNIEKISTNLLIDTYRISFNDGTTQDYEVTNGKGIVSIQKTSTEGLTDIYTITYNDETTATFNVVNGKGIVSIEKTSTSGYVDTYTITYNDGTTSTYEVTNGEVSQAQLDALQDELNYYKTIVNALPKITGSGTSITLNNTADSILSNVLSPSELEQETTTGANLLPFNARTSIASGLNYVCDNKGDIIATGTVTEVTLGYNLSSNKAILEAGNYVLKVVSTGTNLPNFSFNGSIFILNSDNEYNFTLNQTTEVQISQYFHNQTYNSKYYITIAKNTSTTERYTNGASPNPSYPQDIHTISGSNKIVVVGANLVEETLEHSNLNSSGTIVGGSSEVYDLHIAKVIEGQNYTLTTQESGADIVLGFFNTKPIMSSQTYNQERVITRNTTFTAPITGYVAFRSNTGYQYAMLNAGTTALPYTPYVLQEANINLGDIEYCKIGDYEDEFMKPSGSQLFDGELELGNYDSSTGEKLSNNNFIINKNPIPVEELTNYSITINNSGVDMYIFEYKSDLTYNLTSRKTIKANQYWTTNSGTKYVCFRPVASNTNLNSQVMLNKGTSALPYEPYNNGKWYLKKNIGKIVLDGSENWQVYGTGTTSYFYYCNITGRYLTDIGICDHYPYAEIKGTKTTQGIYVINNNVIRIRYGTEDTIANFKTWLQSHNVDVYIVLETPTYTPITGTLANQLEYIYNQMLAYKGQTNISQINDDLPFIIDSTALKDLTSL